MLRKSLRERTLALVDGDSRLKLPVRIVENAMDLAERLSRISTEDD